MASSDFFEPNDFILCDHLIKGGFDEFGNFSGTVRIYKEEVPFVLKNRNPGMEKAYGPFSIKV